MSEHDRDFIGETTNLLRRTPEVLRALLSELSTMPDDVSGEYRQRLGTIGEEVRVELPDGIVTGVAEDVDDDGRLIVATTEGHRVLDVGDVIHMRRSGQ